MGDFWVGGSPGTGKTRFGQFVVTEFLEEGVAPDEIAYVAFTRAAARVAATRCGISGRDSWFRTLHSLCWRLLALDREVQVLTAAKKLEFANRIGLEFSVDHNPSDESLEELYWQVARIERPKLEGDLLMQAYQASRLCCSTLAELQNVRKMPHPAALEAAWRVVPAAYTAFVREYEAFKAENGVVDFVDMLEAALRLPEIPKWRIGIVDEAQDLSPLMWAVIDKVFSGCEHRFLLGDDDQAIYTFAMASVDEFLARRKGARIVLLQQTERFGHEIVEFSQRIVNRLANRQPKDVFPRADRVHEIRTEFEFDPRRVVAGTGTSLVLHRHVAGCREIGRRFLRAGIPYWNERGVNPLARTGEINGYRAFRALSGPSPRPLRSEEILALLEILPSRWRHPDGSTVPMVVHGAKRRLRQLAEDPQRIFSLEFLQQALTPECLAAARASDLRCLDLEFAEYYATLEAAGYDLGTRPSVIITTIHGAKGLEADRVFLFVEAYPRTLLDEREHRVAYVAATRTRGDLSLIREPMLGTWTRAYAYPPH